MSLQLDCPTGACDQSPGSRDMMLFSGMIEAAQLRFARALCRFERQ